MATKNTKSKRVTSKNTSGRPRPFVPTAGYKQSRYDKGGKLK